MSNDETEPKSEDAELDDLTQIEELEQRIVPDGGEIVWPQPPIRPRR